MKLKIIVLFNLLPALVCGQQIVWQNHYGGDGYEYISSWQPFSDILRNDNGEYVLATQTSSFGVYVNQYAIKTASNGELMWQFNAGYPSESDDVRATIKTFDNNYFMIGMANMQGINSGDFRLTKFNDEGDALFSKIIICDSVTSTSAYNICYTPDSNYIAACDHFTKGIVLVKLNNNGDTISTKQVFTDTIISGISVFFQPAPDFSAYYGVVWASSKNWWFKTDMYGNLIAFKQLYIEQNNEPLPEVEKVVMLPNGNTVVHGRADLDNPCEFGIYYGTLQEYDQQGEVVKEHIFCDGQYDTFEDFFVASDGSVYLIKGHRLKKLNADWEDEWQYDLELSEHVWLYKMTQFDYGYIIATGDLWINIDDKDIFMCKIALPEAIGIDEEEENDEIRLYPNPANTQLTIQTNINGKSDYFIYDLTGSLLQSGSFIQAKTIDVKGFAEGVYVIQLQTEQGIVSKKFVKQN